MFEVSGKTGVDARDFVKQYVAELNLRSEQSRCCRRTGQQMQLNMSLLDRAQRVLNDAIKALVGRISNFSHFQPQ